MKTKTVERPAIRVVLELANDTKLERSWTLDEIRAPMGWIKSPPAFLVDCRKAWEHPQDPITFTARVRAGKEQAARTLLGMTGASD